MFATARYNGDAGGSRVAVIIPVYNRAATLIETLPYVLRQSLLPARLVIADDGSTDDTAEKVEAWLSSERPAFDWQVLRLPHTTAATTRQHAFEQVTDLPLVAFLDSDDHWPSDFLARTTAELRTNANLSAVSVDRRYVYANGTPTHLSDCRELAAAPIEWLFRHGGGIASCTVLRTEAVINAGGWQPLNHNEDTNLFLNVALGGQWGHAAGDPVQFNIGHSATRQEAGNLSRQLRDTHVDRAAIHEVFYDRVREANVAANDRQLRVAIASRWQRAGRQLVQLGDTKRARQCFWRSLCWKAFQPKTWVQLAATANRAA